MYSEAVIHSEQVAVLGRLDALGIEQAIIIEAVKEGAAFVLATTKHDPPYLPGILGSGKIVRALRDRLIPQGWTWGNPRNYAITTHPSGSFSIAVASGNANTGREQYTPSTTVEKGEATRDAVYGNLQFQLHEADPTGTFPRVDDATAITLQTWILLHHIDDRNGEIRSELSLASGMDGDGYINRWRERIIFPAEPFGSSPVKFDRPQSGDDAGIVDVPVIRRSAR